MLDGSIIQKLKQKNISADAEKTKERIQKVWKRASKEKKERACELACRAQNTVYRIYQSGSISAALAVAIAQTLDISPFYLTGETDEQSKCSDELLRRFLNVHGYQELLDRYDNMPQDLPVQPEPTHSNPDETVEQLIQRFIQEMTAAIDRCREDFLKNKSSRPVQNIQTAESEQCKENSCAIISDETRGFIGSMSEEDMILLMRATMLRAKSGFPGAAETALKLKTLLLGGEVNHGGS